jgi:hypothetical protein
LVSLVRSLGEHWEWGPHEENTARLLEAQSYALEWSWADRTIDPESAEAKAERAKARKRKPPLHPIVPPAAFRPKRLAEERVQEFLDAMHRHEQPAVEPVTDQDQWALLAQWDAQTLRGLG